jgi:aryl-alcohol dehydrogenase-like predicted oxidoreductase
MKSLAICDKHGWERFATFEGMYSLASRGIEHEIIPLCLDQGVGILAWSPLHGGYLSGKYRRNQLWPQGTRFDNPNHPIWKINKEKLFDIVDELDRISVEHNATISQTALNYLLCKPGINSLIFGMRTAEQLQETLKSTDWHMSPGEVASLDILSEPARDYPYSTFIPDVTK